MGNTQAWLMPSEYEVYDAQFAKAIAVEDEPIRQAMPYKSQYILGAIAVLQAEKRLTRTYEVAMLGGVQRAMGERFLVAMTRIGLVVPKTEQIMASLPESIEGQRREVIVQPYQVGNIVQNFYLTEEGSQVLNVQIAIEEQRRATYVRQR